MSHPLMPSIDSACSVPTGTLMELHSLDAEPERAAGMRSARSAPLAFGVGPNFSRPTWRDVTTCIEDSMLLCFLNSYT